MTEEGKTEEPKTISIEEHNKVVERARTFEGKLADLEKQLEPFKSVNLTELQANNEAYQRLQKEKAEGGSKEDLDALLTAKEKEVRAELQAKIDELEGNYGKTASELKEIQIVDKAFNGLASEIVAGSEEFVKDLIRKNVDSVDGELVIKGQDGKPRYSKTDATKHMTVAEWQAEVKASNPFFFKSTVISGTRQEGEKGSSNGSPARVAPPAGFGSWPQSKQVEWYAANPNAEPPKLF